VALDIRITEAIGRLASTLALVALARLCPPTKQESEEQDYWDEAVRAFEGCVTLREWDFSRQVFDRVLSIRDAVERQKLRPGRRDLDPLFTPLNTMLTRTLKALTQVDRDLLTHKKIHIKSLKKPVLCILNATRILRTLPEETDVALGVDADPLGCADLLERFAEACQSRIAGGELSPPPELAKTVRLSTIKLRALILNKLGAKERLPPRVLSPEQMEVLKRQQSRGTPTYQRLTNTLRMRLTVDVLDIAVHFGMEPTAHYSDVYETASPAVQLMLVAGILTALGSSPHTWRAHVQKYETPQQK